MRILTASLITVLLLVTLGVSPVHAECGDDTYTVRQGETLVSIAEECGLDYWVLININYEMSDPDLIRPGQVIRLTAEVPIEEYLKPVSGPDQPYGLQPGGHEYIVRSGDSLGRIAYLYNTTVNDLYLANPQLGRRPVVFAGQRIIIPWDARKEKGWVGISKLTASSYEQIMVNLIDFPSYAHVNYNLHYVSEDPNDYFSDPDYDVTATGITDARGSTHVILEIPYWAYEGETWIVDVTSPEFPNFKASSPKIRIVY